MKQWVRLTTAAEWRWESSADGQFDPTALDKHRVDEHWALIDAMGQPLAHCSLWWRATASWATVGNDQRLGVIGHYCARDDDAARQLLRRACERLAEQGCTLATGPMDGNTWRRYRVITERGDEPPFFLELQTPDAWLDQFHQQGFHRWAEYSSALTDDLTAARQSIDALAERARTAGVTIRPLQMQSFDAELQRIYAVSAVSFAGNFLFSPIAGDEFAAMYQPLKAMVRPELALLAEHNERPVGFLFALPDSLQAQRGQPVNTVIMKTLAVHPELAGIGLGAWLVAEAHAAAARLGYSRAIHALMLDSNRSRRISNHSARTIRRYALMAKSLR